MGAVPPSTGRACCNACSCPRPGRPWGDVAGHAPRSGWKPDPHDSLTVCTARGRCRSGSMGGGGRVPVLRVDDVDRQPWPASDLGVRDRDQRRRRGRTGSPPDPRSRSGRRRPAGRSSCRRARRVHRQPAKRAQRRTRSADRLVAVARSTDGHRARVILGSCAGRVLPRVVHGPRPGPRPGGVVRIGRTVTSKPSSRGPTRRLSGSGAGRTGPPSARDTVEVSDEPAFSTAVDSTSTTDRKPPSRLPGARETTASIAPACSCDRSRSAGSSPSRTRPSWSSSPASA